MLELDARTVTVLISVVLPIVTGLLTKYNASTTVKQVVSIVVSAVTVLVVENTVGDGSAVLSNDVLFAFVVSLVVQIAAYLGLYQPHDANRSLVPNVGLGSGPAV